MSAQVFKRGAFNLCQKSADSSESDREEGLESTYPDHKKHVRTTKEGSHGKTSTYTLPVEQFLRQFRGGREETVIKLEKFFRGRRGEQSGPTCSYLKMINPLLQLSITLIALYFTEH